MTVLLDRAVASLRALPPDQQDDVARMLLELTGVANLPVELTPEEDASFAESLGQAERGEFASDDAVRAVWLKHRG